MSIGDRIVKARKAAKLSQVALGELVGAAQNTVSSWEQNRTRPTDTHLKQIAKATGVSFISLIGGANSEDFEIPIVGYIGAGSEFYPIDDHEKGTGLDSIEAPPGCPPDAVAVVIKGTSQYPVHGDGDILIYAERRTDVIEFINRRCVCGLADGRIVLKTPIRGSTDKLFTLTSFNAPPMTDVVLDWCAKIEWVKPR